MVVRFWLEILSTIVLWIIVSLRCVEGLLIGIWVVLVMMVMVSVMMVSILVGVSIWFGVAVWLLMIGLSVVDLIGIDSV